MTDHTTRNDRRTDSLHASQQPAPEQPAPDASNGQGKPAPGVIAHGAVEAPPSGPVQHGGIREVKHLHAHDHAQDPALDDNHAALHGGGVDAPLGRLGGGDWGDPHAGGTRAGTDDRQRADPRVEQLFRLLEDVRGAIAEIQRNGASQQGIDAVREGLHRDIQQAARLSIGKIHESGAAQVRAIQSAAQQTERALYKSSAEQERSLKQSLDTKVGLASQQIGEGMRQQFETSRQVFDRDIKRIETLISDQDDTMDREIANIKESIRASQQSLADRTDALRREVAQEARHRGEGDTAFRADVAKLEARIGSLSEKFDGLHETLGRISRESRETVDDSQRWIQGELRDQLSARDAVINDIRKSINQTKSDLENRYSAESRHRTNVMVGVISALVSAGLAVLTMAVAGGGPDNAGPPPPAQQQAPAPGGPAAAPGAAP